MIIIICLIHTHVLIDINQSNVAKTLSILNNKSSGVFFLVKSIFDFKLKNKSGYLYLTST